ncbi:c-type cytochrome [Paenibacillus sp. GXUN7292]|uniref:c-type cytochrome n=1 Tax=Paenibacillus sp. GXUN7292 TaxID=3422499 RepID=UPI003D7DC2B7
MSTKISTGVKLSAAAILLVSLAACGGGGGKKITGRELLDAPMEVSTVYKVSCVSCHGTDLQGRIGPNTNLQKIGERLSKEEIAKQIENGSEGMQPFKDTLTAEEIDGLATWLAGKK